MPVQVRPSGSIPARVMIVGEAPGAEEEIHNEPFVGYSGKELTKMLHEAGINRSQCFVTNVCRERPYKNDIATVIAFKKKDRTAEHSPLRDKWVKRPIHEGFALLRQEIALVKPNIIIAFGNVSLWALTGLWGVTKWRGSMLYTDDFTGHSIKVIPAIHPAAVLRDWSLRAITVQDLRRAARFQHGAPYPKPEWHFTVRPSYSHALAILKELHLSLEHQPIELSFDIETRAGHIACAGISWTPVDGLCIPLMCVENPDGYWSLEEETSLIWWLYKVLTHPNAQVVGQNLLYDSQYTYRHWHFIPRVTQDSMISFHTAYAGLPKRLDYQASMLCDYYRYWKDDGKHWDPKMGEDQLWIYNLEDCVRTAEVAQKELGIIKSYSLEAPHEFQQSMFWPVLQTMIRGVRVDKKARSDMAMELLDELNKREVYFHTVLGHPLNPRSPKQMQELFYADLKLPVQIKRGTGKPTLDDNALDKLATKEPLVRPLIKAIREYRSLGVFLSTFVQAPLDHDARMRCSYNICGTETYRLSSSENAFGSGTNLQNIPKGSKAKEPEELSLPNIRKIFIPDVGYTFFDMDLDRADLQVVVWEADDADLKAALRMGVDMHCMNAMDIYSLKGIPVDELIETHPNYPERRGQIGETKRQAAKTGVHAVDYFCQARTLAIALGCTVKEAQAFIDRWYAAHPGILSWHKRTEAQLHKFRFVENKYGYRRYYFDRVEDLLPEALAWQPQSTVAITINKIWHNIYHNLPEVQILLQVHDSLAGQFPTANTAKCKEALTEASKVIIPYEDPLHIPTGIKTSVVSWGDCK